MGPGIRAVLPSAGAWGSAVLALAGVTTGSLAPLTTLLAWVEKVPFPLGAIPFALLLGYLIYRGIGRVETWTVGGEAHQPAAPARYVAPPDRPPIPEPLPVDWSEGELGTPAAIPEAAPPAPSPPAGTSPGEPLPPGRATLWTKAGGTQVVSEDWPTATVSVTPPVPTSFTQTLVLGFIAVAVALLLLHGYLFEGLDRVVGALGAVVYWPLPWPGLIAIASLRRHIPDYVFVTYLALMVAFCLASGLFTDRGYPRSFRVRALVIIGVYAGVEILADMLFFTVSGRFLTSVFLLSRAIIGGLFFTALLFSTLVFPPPIAAEPHFPRARRALGLFFGTAFLSVVLATLVLYVFFKYFGIGREVLPFAVLLLLPLTALTIWGVIGRLVYEIELIARPTPSLEEFHPSVSVIIPAYNEALGIQATVRSVDRAAALYPGSTQIIVGNDGSVDRTSELARQAIGGLEHATGAVLDLPHGGKSNALNGALRVAEGEIVIRIDGDAQMSRTLGFGALVPHLSDPEVGAVQGLILPLQQAGWTRKLRFMEIAWNHLFLRRGMMATRSAQVVDGAFCAFRRRDLLDLRGWVPWNGEDTEITLRLQRMGYRTRFETAAAAFEDVPEDYAGLRRQRIRWNRGGLFAHRRHLGALFGTAFEFGGLSILLWLSMFIRGGLRNLVWVFAVLATLLRGLPTLSHVALITAILLIPRGLVIGYYLVKYGKRRFLIYVPFWPIAGVLKQGFTFESFGSMLPGSQPEFSE
ncbi:MAG TPA: glycosyltransferase family 2 protein [Thermoplasmata archaeon]|nr:glycosyltransferase family 2 protein [Thermoplasmata archaeon]